MSSLRSGALHFYTKLPILITSSFIQRIIPLGERGPPTMDWSGQLFLWDGRILRAMALLRETPELRMRLVHLSTAVALSPSRLSHLFREQVGLPIRRFLLWLRLREALSAVARGESLTTAAHAAGFSDSAHFTRTFRRMLGIPLWFSRIPRDFRRRWTDSTSSDRGCESRRVVGHARLQWDTVRCSEMPERRDVPLGEREELWFFTPLLE